MSGLLLLGNGCANQLNDDWLELSQTQSAIIDKFIEFERAHMNVMKGSIEKTFDLYEKEVARLESSKFFDPRTVVGTDGVARIMEEGEDGTPVAIRREKMEAFVQDVIRARSMLAQKKAEWNTLFNNWEQLLDDVEKSNELTLQTAEDIHAALESAQRILDDATRIAGTIAAITATYFIAAP
jgi:hypothetical protein